MYEIMGIGTKFCSAVRKNTEVYRHGINAVLITAMTMLSLTACILLSALYAAGIISDLGALIASGIVVVVSVALLGPRLIYDYSPALCRMVLGFVRGQPTIHHTGVWEGEKVEKAHFFDRQLCNELCKFLSEEKAQSIADFGCGMGKYVQTIRQQLNIACDGFDGNPDTPALSKGTCQVQNIAVSFRLRRQYDFVMSLEVGEHLPKDSEEVFIDNLIAHAKKGIVLSWAKKGQGGHGHINEQDAAYIKEIFAKKGWENDAVAERRLGNASYPVYFWFYDTIMVFRKS